MILLAVLPDDVEHVLAKAFLYGDDPAAVATVTQLISEIGLDPVDVGAPDGMAKVETAIGTMWSVLAPQFGREYSP
ncbi:MULTISPECIES: hypothetical protein [Paenibacillus]|uniref:hypothetical protein n=1 Tax=Paenibacillus TaxID=44249 RepID=UPI0022B90B97|nr:hypothetical protein [Paenibacillus caseinilyticus]MCZ8520835.1 hypothetical protein [Paenibacillus caseinilyticus]